MIEKLILVGLAMLALMMGVACGLSEEQEAEKAADRTKGFHCLSAWDGNHDGLEALVRDRLKDPGSMETHKTQITPVQETTGQHRIIMDFGSRNSFGGMVRNQAIGWVDPDTCEATLVAVE